MPRLTANRIDIAYQVSGRGEPLLLVMGLGGQLTDWPAELVAKLERQFTVIRFDNRDSGLSSYIDAAVPRRRDIVRAALPGSRRRASYSLDDMADDAHGLLTGLGMGSAHVLGISLGAMVAQTLVLRHPQSVRSLCSIMSSTGDRRAGRPTPRILLELARRGRRVPAHDQALAVTLRWFALVGGQDWDQDQQRRRSAASINRAFYPAGVLRQTLAVAQAPDRTAALGLVEVPTLVIHGLDDPLIGPSGGVATAKAIAHSRLLLLANMGHDLPRSRHDEIVAAVNANAARAGDRREP